MSWYQRGRAQYGMFIKREFPTMLEECFQTPIEGAIYPEIIDKLRVQGAIRQAVVDTSSLVHTAWDLGSPLNTVTWYFQIVAAEIRVIECDSDLDLTPVQRVARMFNKGYLYGSHFLPHDAMATMHSGKTFLTGLGAAVGTDFALPVLNLVCDRWHMFGVVFRIREVIAKHSAESGQERTTL
jgi:hypothetical protein